MQFNSQQVNVILNALRVAEQTYREDAAAMHAAGQARIGAQFDHQVKTTAELTAYIEEQQ